MTRADSASIRISRVSLVAVGAFATAVATAHTALAADVAATPADYKGKVAALNPGDTLQLAAGDYTSGMNIFNLNGIVSAPIVIEGPAQGPPARFLGVSGKNTIDIRDSSYVTIRNLLLDGKSLEVDAIKAGGNAKNWAHHITIEGCTITGHDVDQQIVGISTKIVVWDWVLRNNVIDGAGTGAYFGNSDGTRAFIGGLIENNLFKKTIGYNMQVKYQKHRQEADVPQVPMDKRVTVIRHNVFIKQELPSTYGARPNLLTDGFPASGPGSDDHYEIYGNFFYHNDGDALFQGNGRIHLHDNLFVDSKNAAINLMAHDGKSVIDALIYDNTIYDTATGIAFGSKPSGSSFVAGNAIFSPKPLLGIAPSGDNVTGTVADAATYVTSPSKQLGKMNFFPKAGSKLKGPAMDMSAAKADLDHDRDFNGVKRDFTYRGAYHGEGTNSGWQPDATLKGTTGSGGFGGAGGTSSTGGMAGAAAGAAGTNGVGGEPGTGGSTADAGVGASANDAGDDGGCSCSTRQRDRRLGASLFVLTLLFAATRRLGWRR